MIIKNISIYYMIDKDVNLIKKLIFILIILYFTTFLYAKGSSEGNLDKGINTQASYLLGNIPQNSIIAIVGISSGSENLSRYITEELTSYIMKNKKSNIRIVERAAMPILQKEINFQYSGAVDDKFMISLGKMVGANTVITGTIYSLNNNLRFNVRAINIETTEIIASNGVNFAPDNKVKKLINGNKIKETLDRKNIPIRQPDGSISKANKELKENQKRFAKEVQQGTENAVNGIINFFSEDIVDRNPRYFFGYNYCPDYPFNIESGYLRNGLGFFSSFGFNLQEINWAYINGTGDITGEPISTTSFAGGITYPLYFDWLWLAGGFGIYFYKYASKHEPKNHSVYYSEDYENKIGISLGFFVSIKRFYFTAKYQYLFNQYQPHNFMLGIGLNFEDK